LGLLSRQLPRRQAKGYADSAELRTGLGVFWLQAVSKIPPQGLAILL
jgi:hypothetical protein